MSTQYSTSGTKTFTAGEALVAWRAVLVHTDGTAKYADVDEDQKAIGCTIEAAASGALVQIRLFNSPGTFKLECADSITAGALCYVTTDGAISDTVNTSQTPRFVALHAVSNANELVECGTVL